VRVGQEKGQEKSRRDRDTTRQGQGQGATRQGQEATLGFAPPARIAPLPPYKLTTLSVLGSTITASPLPTPPRCRSIPAFSFGLSSSACSAASGVALAWYCCGQAWLWCASMAVVNAGCAGTCVTVVFVRRGARRSFVEGGRAARVEEVWRRIVRVGGVFCFFLLGEAWQKGRATRFK